VAEQEAESVDLMARQAKKTPTPLPPDRPAGAVITEVQDAVQEFLTDWLVRRNYDQALLLVSDQALACVSTEAAAGSGTRSSEQKRQDLRATMKRVSEQLGAYENLTEAVEAVIPWRKAFRVVKQPFEGEFTLVQAPEAFAKSFLCQDRSDAALTKALDDPAPTYGEYYGAVLRLRAKGDAGGVLGLLWGKEDSAWRLLSWKVYEQ
jgi:hypothetical protein